MNDDSDVEMLEEAPAIRVRSDSEEFLRQERKKRRRKIRRMERRAKGYPSFVSLLTVNYDSSDDETEQSEPDPYLIPSTTTIEPLVSSQADKIVQPKRLRIDVNAKLGLKEGVAIKVEDGSMIERFPDAIPSAVANHRDEGWYEGIIPMPMPEDSHFLPPLHAWIRRQFEFFSATVEDASLLQAGRRPVTIGRVGIRCIHCRAAHRSARDPWPVGAVSYPANLNALYTMCTQKPSSHFEQHCRYMPDDMRQEFDFIQQSERSTKRAKGGISAALYYVVAAKRRGLTDTEDGVRFERDLSLDPLPLDTIKQQHQQLQQLTDDYDDPASSTIASPARVTSSAVAPAVRISADEASERVLAQAIAESDEGHLCKAEHKSLLTDFMFLTIRQMKLCLAIPSDLSSRGKKSKAVRLGLAGYCCRHCENTIDNYRSYPSAADHMLSSISNSFAVHLQKCRYMPNAIKRALIVYKRLHTKQMAQLPYGSQRKFIHEYFWEKLRAEDKTEEEMAPIIASLPVEPTLPPQPVLSAASTGAASVSANAKLAKGAHYPTVDDKETSAILKAAENDWDPAVNDFLIRPEDRNLVSDYVFLTMRQLKAVGPNNTARSQLSGLSCIHCHDREYQVSPSGRSYPSAPDNYASALNTSYYNHFQNCVYVPADLKRALIATRKIHSLQCSSLQFGSQRKYFNRLFNRLQSFDPPTAVSESAKTDAFRTYGFINVSTKQQPCWICQKCSSTPIAFRAPGSVWFHTPDLVAVLQHQQNCHIGKWDLGHAGTLLKEGIEEHCEKSSLLDGALRMFLPALLGENSDLIDVVTIGLENVLRSGSGTVEAKCSLNWLPTEVNFDKLQSAFESFANALQWKGSRYLGDLPKFCVFLKFLAPCLEIPLGEEENILVAAKEEEDTKVSNDDLEEPSADNSEEFENHDEDDDDEEEEDDRFTTEASEEDITPSESHQDFTYDESMSA